MSNDNVPLLQLPPAEFEAALDRVFGPDPLTVRCAYCGQEPDEFCTTPSGRSTLHRVRIRAVRGDMPDCTGAPGCPVEGHEMTPVPGMEPTP